MGFAAVAGPPAVQGAFADAVLWREGGGTVGCEQREQERWCWIFGRFAAVSRWIRVSFRPLNSLVVFFWHRPQLKDYTSSGVNMPCVEWDLSAF